MEMEKKMAWIGRMTGLLPVLLLLLMMHTMFVEVEAAADPTMKDLAESQVEWMKTKGGYFSPKISVRPLFESDSAPEKVPLGLFAKEGFVEGETLMVVPRECLLTAGPSSVDMCDTARNLLHEYRLMQRGEQSDFEPYVSYVFSKAGDGEGEPLPSSWSPKGKELLLKIRGKHFPPEDLTTVTFRNDCDGAGDDGLEEFAYRTVVSRGWSDKLVPIFDMINHQSGRHANVDSTRVQGEGDITVFATRDIGAGDQFFLSYMDCIDERGYENDYVLPHMLRDFGLIDQHPQRWTFPAGPGSHENLVFDLDVPHREDMPSSEWSCMDTNKSCMTTTEAAERLRIDWRTDEPTANQLMFLKQELSRLQDLERYVYSTLDEMDLLSNERTIAMEYYQGMTTALTAITGMGHGSNKTETYTISERLTGTSLIPQEAADNETRPNWLGCDEYKRAPLQPYYKVRSSYQKIKLSTVEENDDTCLYMNNWLHTCASFRPHYHEVLVHYPARFLKEIKRVIFIGGGDSMVLHEVLKYPSLELVVGLELDQEVVRASFIGFGSQPHWDDPRVQWYYGDAAKSMSILPREYYGSFDLVLVDIQTEVASKLRVNDELNLMEAAMLLMKPEGIIVKNEDEGYLPGSKSGFTKYSVDLVYHDVPLYCLQEIVVGSDSIDFLTATPKDHGVKTLYLEGVETFQSQFDSWYNFGKEDSGKPSYCEIRNNLNRTKLDEERSGSMGVLMILETENVEVTIESAEDLQPSITKALNDNGISEIEITSSQLSKGGSEGFSLIQVAEQGYVTLRCFPDIQYCACDIQLYGGSVEKLDLIAAEILNVIQSNQTSSYRFVTEGMAFANDGNTENVGPPTTYKLCQDDFGGMPQTSSGKRIRKEKLAAEFGPPKASTLHSYDNDRALSQWQSEKAIGIQILMQFAVPSTTDISSAPSLLNDGINAILKGRPARKQVLWNTVGDGLVIIASWADGSIVATFDGASRVDLNLFSLSTDLDVDKVFSNVEKRTDWEDIAVQYFPRGTGSVVNFPEEIKQDIKHPVWG